MCVFLFALEREALAPDLCVRPSVCVCMISAHPYPSFACVVYPPPPLWTSLFFLNLLCFSSQLAPFSLVTARALNFHGRCLFLARSSSPPFLILSIILPYSLSCHSAAFPSSTPSRFSPKPNFPLLFFPPPPPTATPLPCLPSSGCCWRREHNEEV